MIDRMPEPARIMVALRVMGDALVPEEVTRLLGVEPTANARTGDVRRTRSGREVAYSTNLWLLEAEAASSGDPAFWRGLSHRFHCDLFCGLFVDGGNARAGSRPEVLAMLGEPGLRLDLDMYACAD